MYVPRFFVSAQQRFGGTDIKTLSASQLLGLGQTVLQLFTALFYLEDGRRVREREREREKEKSARTLERESIRERFGSSFYVFFSSTWPALCKLGLARSVVCSA